MKRFSRMAVCAAAFAVVQLAPSLAAAESLPEELRRSFTIGGKPIPPLAFADFGDTMLSDNRPIVTAIDARAAIDSNRYSGEIAKRGNWFEQQAPGAPGFNGPPTISYEFRGAAANGMLVVVTAYSGGGTGVFTVLHLLEAVQERAFDADGSVYQQLDLKLVRSYPLGDRWQGDVVVTGDRIQIRPGSNGAASATIEARRP